MTSPRHSTGEFSLMPCRLFRLALLLPLLATGCSSAMKFPTLSTFNRDTVDYKPRSSVASSEEDEKPGFLDRLVLGKGEPIRWGLPGSRRKDTLGSELANRERSDRDILQKAQTLYEKADYAGASELFQVIAKERNPKKFRLFGPKLDEERPLYDPIREEAVFYLAESQFMQNRLVDAQEYYKVLVKDFPQSRYLDESTRRMFDIAQRWLGVEDFATPGEIQRVSFDGSNEAPLSTKPAKARRFGWFPNFTDPSRPAMDVSGRAVDALKTIWLNDPTGPLADDALMLAATHHLRAGRYRDSARLLRILREEFPKSPHLKNAFVIGSKVELMSYQGSSYDEQKLLEARDLSESSLRLFPGLEDADRLRTDLKKINEEEAKREWERVLLWEKKNKPKAVAVYCRELLKNFPQSSYAARAQAKLVELGEAAPTTESDSTPQEPAPIGRVPLNSLENPVQPFQSVPDQGGDGPVFENDVPIIDDKPASSTPVGRVRL